MLIMWAFQTLVVVVLLIIGWTHFGPQLDWVIGQVDQRRGQEALAWIVDHAKGLEGRGDEEKRESFCRMGSYKRSCLVNYCLKRCPCYISEDNKSCIKCREGCLKWDDEILKK